jgi:hypothetical protein
VRAAFFVLLICGCDDGTSMTMPGFTANLTNIDSNATLTNFTATSFGAGVIGGYSDAVAISSTAPCPQVNMYFVGKLTARDYTISGTAQAIMSTDTDPSHAYLDYSETCMGQKSFLPVGGGVIHVTTASAQRVELRFDNITLEAPCSMGDTVCQNRQGGNTGYGNLSLSGSGSTTSTTGL